jgi:hypothetical protein
MLRLLVLANRLLSGNERSCPETGSLGTRQLFLHSEVFEGVDRRRTAHFHLVADNFWRRLLQAVSLFLQDNSTYIRA